MIARKGSQYYSIRIQTPGVRMLLLGFNQLGIRN